MLSNKKDSNRECIIFKLTTLNWRKSITIRRWILSCFRSLCDRKLKVTEIDRRMSWTVVMYVGDCISHLLEYLKHCKGEPKSIQLELRKKWGIWVRNFQKLGPKLKSWKGFKKFHTWLRRVLPIQPCRCLTTVKFSIEICGVKQNYVGKLQYLLLLCSNKDLDRAFRILGKTYVSD